MQRASEAWSHPIKGHHSPTVLPLHPHQVPRRRIKDQDYIVAPVSQTRLKKIDFALPGPMGGLTLMTKKFYSLRLLDFSLCITMSPFSGEKKKLERKRLIFLLSY